MTAALVVEDNPITLMQAVDVLARAGILSYTCYSPEAALPILQSDHAKIRFLFISAEKLSLMDGFALAKIAAVRWPEIDLVVASARRRPAFGNLPVSAMFFDVEFSAAVVEERLKLLHVKLNATASYDYPASELPISASYSEWPG